MCVKKKRAQNLAACILPSYGGMHPITLYQLNPHLDIDWNLDQDLHVFMLDIQDPDRLIGMQS